MPPRRIKERSDDSTTAVELSELATGVAEAVLAAKLRLDQDALAVADRYKTSPTLRLLSPPAFMIGEVRVLLKFAVAEVERSAPAQREAKHTPLHIHVLVAATALAKLPPHLVSEIELRVAPEMRRAQPAEADGDGPE